MLDYINTEDQIADIFTKPLREDRFCYLRKELGIIDINALIDHFVLVCVECIIAWWNLKRIYYWVES